MNKTISIMQPYFLPYIGYWQLIKQSDEFVVYDNIKYTKKGWINRNRYLYESQDKTFTLPLERDSDFLDIRERKLAADFNKAKLLNQIREAYRRAPFFNQTFELFEKIIMYEESNLFKYILYSIKMIMEYLDIKTQVITSSNIDIDHMLKSSQKVLAICKKQKATRYVNPIGGIDLYDKKEFLAHNIELKFLRANEIVYAQLGDEFVGSLSILDILMFNGNEKTCCFLELYRLE